MDALRPPQRLHALDNLRALMMWLGIVLHVAANHLTGPMLVPWRDAATSPVADLLAAVIHVFRMPVFLMLAGYFVALLVERRGAAQMLHNRMKRIALPFVIFWPFIFALTGVVAMLYVHRAARGTFGLSMEIVPTVPHVPLVNTMHMWFLYQLAGLTLLTYGVLRLIPRLPSRVCDSVSTTFRVLGVRPWGFAVLALPLGWIGAQYPYGILTVTGSFVPPLVEWLHHGLFYAFGCFLYLQRDVLLPHYTRKVARLAWAGALFCAVSLGMIQELQRHPDTAGLAFRFGAAWAYNARHLAMVLCPVGPGPAHPQPPQRDAAVPIGEFLLGVSGAHARHHRIWRAAVRRPTAGRSQDAAQHRGNHGHGSGNVSALCAPYRHRPTAQRPAYSRPSGRAETAVALTRRPDARHLLQEARY
jgi:fucose 4-O-acetylase-like acetyltransferase